MSSWSPGRQLFGKIVSNNISLLQSKDRHRCCKDISKLEDFDMTDEKDAGGHFAMTDEKHASDHFAVFGMKEADLPKIK